MEVATKFPDPGTKPLNELTTQELRELRIVAQIEFSLRESRGKSPDRLDVQHLLARIEAELAYRAK
jgi:hypothetical protein